MPEDKLKLEDLIGEKPRNGESERIDYVGIIGAGVMGQGIAQTISAAGVDVLIVEKDNEHLQKAQENLKGSMEREVARWAMTTSEVKSILSRIKWTTELQEISDCDLIIEAVDESYDLKVSIFTQLDKIAGKDTIIISNTSTLSLTKIADATTRKDKIIGMHFLNPVPKVPLVELIKGLETSDKTVKVIKSFASRIGKTAVEVYEYPGFVTTRAIAKDIDTAMKLGYDFKMGPLEMADSMGLDEVLVWMETLWHTLGEPRYRPCPILRKHVRERKLGKKTGEGFYTYDADGKILY